MSKRSVRYKYCIVPLCTNTTITTPNKVFISVPAGEKIRKQWCEAMKRDEKHNAVLSSTSNRFCCEDHFELKNDMENYMQWKIMGSSVRLKKGVLPHIFNCQRPTYVKSKTSAKRKICYPDVLQRLDTSTNPPPPTSTSKEWINCGSADTETNPIDLPDSESTFVLDTTRVKNKKIQKSSKKLQTHTITNKTSVCSLKKIRRLRINTNKLRTAAAQKSETGPPLPTSTILLADTLKCSQPSTSSSSPSIDPFKEEPSCSREEEPGFAPTLELLPEQADQPHLDMATRSFKGSKDKMYCRLCLKPAYKNSLTPLSVVDFNYPGKNDAFKKKKREKVEEINKMLRFCLPFFNSLTFNPIICSICLGRLKIAYEFSKECLKSQRLIEKYAETYGTTEKVINLNEMIETKFELFNEENISDTETTVSGIPKVTRSNARVSSKRQYSNEDSPPAKKLKDYHETHEEDSLSSSNDDTSNIKIEPDDDDSCALTKSVKTEPDEDDSAYMERVIQDVPKDYIIDPNKSDDETTIKVEPNYFDTPDFIKSEPVDELQVESKLFNERTGIGTVIAGEDSEFHEMENVPLNTTKAPLFARGTVFPHVGSSLEDTTSDVIK